MCSLCSHFDLYGIRDEHVNQIVLSHWAQSTEDLGLYESFPARQLRTTMDVTCPEYIEWIHGGLNMQVTHHVRKRHAVLYYIF